MKLGFSIGESTTMLDLLLLPLLLIQCSEGYDGHALRRNLSSVDGRKGAGTASGAGVLDLFAAAGATVTNHTDDNRGANHIRVGTIIAGSYVVEFDDDDPDPVKHAQEVCQKMFKKDPDFVLESTVKGFAVSGITRAQASKLQRLEGIRAVIPDRAFGVDPIIGHKPLQKTDSNTNHSGHRTLASSPHRIPQEVGWGVKLIWGGKAPRKYNGDNVAWVIDSGIADHPDLNIDRSKAFTAFPPLLTKTGRIIATPTLDGDGHGTHVAGIIGAKDNNFGIVGVAPGATVIPVQVIQNGIGTLATVLAGIDHVAKYAKEGDVVTLALGDAYTEELNQAVVMATKKGLKFCIAAGNSANDTALISPASVDAENAFVISAVDKKLNFSFFSNYGSSVDYACPGEKIKSTYLGNSYFTNIGTSMAVPHFCGALLQESTGKYKIGIQGYAGGYDPDGVADPIPILLKK